MQPVWQVATARPSAPVLTLAIGGADGSGITRSSRPAIGWPSRSLTIWNLTRTVAEPHPELGRTGTEIGKHTSHAPDAEHHVPHAELQPGRSHGHAFDEGDSAPMKDTAPRGLG